MPLEEYNTLLSRISKEEDITLEKLKDYAKSFNMLLVRNDSNQFSPSESQNANSRRISLHSGDHSSMFSVDSLSTGQSVYYDATQSSQVIDSRVSLLTASTTNSSAFTDALDNNIPENETPLLETISRTSTVRADDDATGTISLPTIDDLRTYAKQLGYVLIPVAETSDPSPGVPELVDDGGNESEDELFDEKELERKAERFGKALVTLSDFEYFDNLKNGHISRDLLNKGASNLGLIIMEEATYENLEKQATIDEAKIRKISSNYGLVVLKKEELEHLREQLNDNELTVGNIKERASKLGFVPVTLSNYETLMASVAKKDSTGTDQSDLKEQESKSSYVAETQAATVLDSDMKKVHQGTSPSEDSVTTEGTINKEATSVSNTSGDNHLTGSEEAGRGVPQNKEDFIRLASEYGLISITKTRFDQIREELENPTFSKEQLIKEAMDFNMIIITKEEYEDLQKLKEENDFNDTSGYADETHDIDNEVAQLKKDARKYGLLSVPESAFIVTSYGNEPDENNVVVLPVSFYNSLLTKGQEQLSKVSDEELKKEANKRGFIMKLHWNNDSELKPPPIISASTGTRPASHFRTTSVESMDSPLGKSVASASGSIAFSDYDYQNSNKNSLHSRKTSLAGSHSSKGIQGASKSLRTASVDGGMSLATVASLSEPRIIPALTQTVIGEYLYKYYPRLGPLGSEARHERYFWIHPYTLTLYWSESNPIMENPSKTKTKGAAILGVESVIDNNPLPVGLYHKSIVVRAENRNIKFTCSTRQRHNIWYNSLRYLLQRSMEGIDLENIADDPSDMLYSGKIFPLPGEDQAHANRRLTISRRSRSYSSLRRKIPNRPSSIQNLRTQR